MDLESLSVLPKSRFDFRVNSKEPKKEILETWAASINQACSSVNSGKILGFGIAIPGAFNYKKGIALFEGNDKYDALYGVDVAKELRSLLDLPELPIRFINDATAFAIGTALVGEAKDYHRSLAITLGTGFGSALIEDGKPMMRGQDAPSSGLFWRLPFRNGIADDYFSTRRFISQFQKLSGNRLNGVREMTESFKDNEHVPRVFEETLAEFLAPWVQKLQIKILVIGGNVSRSLHLFEKLLLENLSTHGVQMKIKKSGLRETAALIGSSKILIDDYWESIRKDLPQK